MIDEKVKKWLLKAIEDFKTAKKLMADKEEKIITSAVCFHSQQFVEKILKTFLFTKNIDFEKTHNLKYLLTLCKDIDNEFKNLDTGNLTFYAVQTRYPDEFYIPTFEEAKESFKIALSFKDFIFTKLGINDEDLKY